MAVALLSLFITGCVKGQENSLKEAEILLNSGDSLLAKGSYDDAREKFKEILEKFPDFHKDSARLLIARSYLKQKDYAQAYIAFDRLATRKSKDYAQADLDFVQALGFDLSNVQEEAMYRTAYCSNQLGRYEEALALYMDFRTRSPKSKYVPDAYFDIGEIYSKSKSYDLALASYDLALKSYGLALKGANDPNSHRSKAEIQDAIGRTYYDQGDLEKARAAFKLLLEKYEESAEVIYANYMIAHIYRKEKKSDEAITKYRSMIENKIDGSVSVTLDGLSIEVNTIAFSYFEIGKAYKEKANFEEAFKAYERIVKEPEKGEGEKDLREDPLAPFALYHSMDMLNKLWDEEELQSDVKEELWSDPKEEFDREEVLEDFAGKYIKYISDRSEGKPFLAAEAQFQFARIQYELEQYDKAAKENAKLQDYKPSYTRLNLIKLRGKYYEGLCYKNDNNPEWKEAYEEVTILFKLNFQPLIDFPNIDIDFPDIDNPDVGNHDHYISTALWYAGRANEKLSKLKEAEKAFELLIRRYPKSGHAEEAKDKRKKIRQKLKLIEELRHELDDKVDNEMDSSDASGSHDSSEKAQTQQLTAQDIAEIAKGSTVFIETKKGYTGSGFFVKPDQIATNFHVIEKDAVEATARLVGTEEKYAIVGYTALDADRDLAILKVRAFGVKPLKLGDSDYVEQGMEAYPIGSPLGFVNVVSDGKISSIQWVESIRRLFNNGSKISDRPQNETPQKLLMMTAPISPGNSGGPVLNGKGEVIGVAVGYRREGQNLNFAIPVNDLKALLKMVGPPKPLSNLDPIY